MRELVLHCHEAHAEALSDALLNAGALSVSVEDADSQTPLEQPLYGEPGLAPEVQAWQRNRLVALLEDGTDPAQLLALIDDAPEVQREPHWVMREVPNADWVRITQAQFTPIAIGQNIWIIPSWHQQDAPKASQAEGAIRIELDPGLAFGTGSHPTTHLCLAWLEACLQKGETVLDYGCGSGILAIAARLLGAGAVDAVDIDGQAVQAARANFQINHVPDIRALLPDELPNVQPTGQYQVVVANILASPLKVLAPMLANRVIAGGALVLSGVLERQADEVAHAYAPWLDMQVWQRRDGWVCLSGRKAAD